MQVNVLEPFVLVRIIFVPKIYIYIRLSNVVLMHTCHIDGAGYAKRVRVFSTFAF